MVEGKQEFEKKVLTPEQDLQRFKEWTTAFLGILIIGFTLVLASATFLFVNDANAISNAKDVLQILIGISGVVIGYYFGRLPADARAAQAQDQVDAANEKVEDVRADARNIAIRLQNQMDKVVPPQAGVRGEQGATSAEMQGIRDELLRIASGGKRLV